MSVQKAFLTKSGKANFSCPECGKTKQMDVSRFGEIKKEVKLKCTCSACKHIFPVILERRLYFRKSVFLDGELIVDDNRTSIKVVDISRVGLKIQIQEETQVSVNDKIVIEFALDDISNSLISKEMIVKSISGASMGLAFISDKHYDKLGNYIAFQLG